MPPKTARQLLEDEVKEFRRELMRDVTTRSEFRSLGFEPWEIDDLIDGEKEDIEWQVAKHREKLLAELPERERQLDEEREYAFAQIAFDEIWLPNCLTSSEGEDSGLVTRDVYEHYVAWATDIGIAEPFSFEKVRPAVRDHYGIESIRTGLKEYRLVNVETKVNRGQLISRYEAKEREREREYQKLRGLTCSYCERRKYDGNRFDRCYWCYRILKDGLQAALSEYLSQDVGWERTGQSMHLAYQRMIAKGEVSDPSYRQPAARSAPSRATGAYQPQRQPGPSNRPQVRSTNGNRQGIFALLFAFALIVLIAICVNVGAL